MTVDDRWIASSDPDLDVGFVTVDPLNGRNIADVLGADALGVNEGFTNIVRVVGYPTNGEDPISCVNKTTQQSPHQMRFACNGYYGGTSGSPWLTHYDPATRTGHVIGVIGGYQQGGATPEVSYSSYFDNNVQSLYDKAAAKG
jgi:V8-like Glu-specific endopeptidase